MADEQDWCLDISKSLGLPVITGQKSSRKGEKTWVHVDGYIPKFPRCIIEFTDTGNYDMLRTKFKRVVEYKEIYNVEYAFLISISKQNSGDEEQKIWESWVGKQSSDIKNEIRFYNCDLEKREAIADLTDFIRSDQGIIHRKISVSEFNLHNVKFQRKPIQEVIEKMKKKKWGRIINYGSLASRRALPSSIAYGASKGGIEQLTRAMAEAWSPHGINVNAIGPGFFPTELTVPVFNDKERSLRNAKQTCIGRNGELEDLDGPLLFLCSKASDYVTGQLIFVDGGFTSK